MSVELRCFPMINPPQGATVWQGRVYGSPLWIRIYEAGCRLKMAANGISVDVTELVTNHEVMYG